MGVRRSLGDDGGRLGSLRCVCDAMGPATPRIGDGRERSAYRESALRPGLDPFRLCAFRLSPTHSRYGAGMVTVAFGMGLYHWHCVYCGGHRYRCGPIGAAGSRTLRLGDGLFGLLVWVPIVAAGHVSAFQQAEVASTIALTAAGWVVADSYRGMPWFGGTKARVKGAKAGGAGVR